MTVPTIADGYQRWRNSAFDALRLVVDDGNLPKPMVALGYVGLSAGGAFAGENGERGMLRVTSSWAGRVFRSVYHQTAHYSRLDLQVTLWGVKGGDKHGAQQRRAADRFNNALPKFKQRKVHIREGNDGGYTLYIGAPTSEQKGRVYNKGAEDKTGYYHDAWRYEVELHNDAADRAAHYLASLPTDIAPAVVASVVRWFGERGVTVPIAPEDVPSAIVPTQRPRTDIERSIAWLREQVQPTVRRLRQLGLEDQVLDALGLLHQLHGPALVPPVSIDGLDPLEAIQRLITGGDNAQG